LGFSRLQFQYLSINRRHVDTIVPGAQPSSWGFQNLPICFKKSECIKSSQRCRLTSSYSESCNVSLSVSLIFTINYCEFFDVGNGLADCRADRHFARAADLEATTVASRSVPQGISSCPSVRASQRAKTMLSADATRYCTAPSTPNSPSDCPSPRRVVVHGTSRVRGVAPPSIHSLPPSAPVRRMLGPLYRR